MKFLVLIPARYESTRFPGKPLAKLGGIPMIVRVCRQVEKSGFPLAVATDNEEIRKTVEEAGFRAVITSKSHRSGTDRVEEALRNLEFDADVVINVQGDEPFIDPEQIKSLAKMFVEDSETQIATMIRQFPADCGYETVADPNVVKVVTGDKHQALYFSRSVIPFVRKYPKEEWLEHAYYFAHVGIYAYRSDVLKEIVSLPQSSLEIAESLEQLRWLQAGYMIKTVKTDKPTIGIDTPADLEAAEKYI